MGIKKIDGFILITYKADHPPYHVHICYGGKELGRFDIENQKPMDKKLIMTRKLKEALKKADFLR